MIEIQKIEIPMRVGFKHATATRTVTDGILVIARRGDFVGKGEGCPRSYVTGEDSDSAIAWIRSKQNQFLNLQSLEELEAFTTQNKKEIDLHPAAWCALELALLDLLSQEKGVSVEKFLNLASKKESFHYTAVLGDDSIEKMSKYLNQYLMMGFTDFKIKISGDLAKDQEKLSLFKDTNLKVRIDGNNVWAGNLKEAIRQVSQYQFPVWGVEEPLAPRDYKNLETFSKELQKSVILDESLTNESDLLEVQKYEGTFVPNIRISKMGGILRSLKLLEQLKVLKWKIIIGAQVGETSILSRAAMTIASEAGDQLYSQEGAYGTLLLEKDIVSPLVMMGPKGIVRWDFTENKGWGLNLNP